MIHDLTKKYEWDGVEFEHVEKTVDWYWGLGIIIVTGCVIAIISKNYLLTVLLVLGGSMLVFYANDKAEPVHVELSDRGIKINKDLFTYTSIKSFWMYQDHHDRNRIVIVTGGKIMPKRIITLPETIPAKEIHDFLSQYIDEIEAKPSSIDILADSLGL